MMLGYIVFTLLESVQGTISYAVAVQGNKVPPQFMDDYIQESFLRFETSVMKNISQDVFDGFRQSVYEKIDLPDVDLY